MAIDLNKIERCAWHSCSKICRRNSKAVRKTARSLPTCPNHSFSLHVGVYKKYSLDARNLEVAASCVMLHPARRLKILEAARECFIFEGYFRSEHRKLVKPSFQDKGHNSAISFCLMKRKMIEEHINNVKTHILLDPTPPEAIPIPSSSTSPPDLDISEEAGETLAFKNDFSSQFEKAPPAASIPTTPIDASETTAFSSEIGFPLSFDKAPLAVGIPASSFNESSFPPFDVAPSAVPIPSLP